MYSQRHIIRRQILELHTPEHTARQLPEEMHRVFRSRIVPEIDRCCSELSSPDRIDRIESLVLDIGRIDPDNLEAELTAKVIPRLRAALAEQIGQQNDQPEGRASDQKTECIDRGTARSQLELFAFFARHGSLPWWADSTDRDILDTCLGNLLEHSPEPLRRLMRELAAEPRALQRLIVQYSDKGLHALAALSASFLKKSVPATPYIIRLLQRSEGAAMQPSASLRQRVWIYLLREAAMAGITTDDPANLYLPVLRRLATDCKMTSEDLAKALTVGLGPAGADSADPAAALPDSVRELVHTLRDRLRGDPETSQARRLPVGAPDSKDSMAIALSEIRRHLMPRLSGQAQAEMNVLLRRIKDELEPRNEEKWGERYRKTAQSILILLSTILTDHPLHTIDRNEIRVLKDVLPALTAAAQITKDETAELSRKFQLLHEAPSEAKHGGSTAKDEEQGSTLDLSFSAGEEIYIDNAGLVILWPFIQHYVQHLDLLDPEKKNAFRDEPARHRATGLLQHLVDGEDWFPEYLLPLNKVLCSMELHRVFDFGEPLTEAEQTEGENLLRAVIAQASILRDMSIPVLRSTFLLRRGKLSSRDGAWLLQVERETFDVVLDRFPWGWEWVKLPWMETPVRVEW